MRFLQVYPEAPGRPMQVSRCFSMVSAVIAASEPGEIAHINRFSDGRTRRADSDPRQLRHALAYPAAGLARVMSSMSVNQTGLGQRPTR